MEIKEKGLDLKLNKGLQAINKKVEELGWK